MELIKIIKFAYIAFTVYAFIIVDVTSLKLINILPAVIIMWLFYFSFTLGYRTKIKSRMKNNAKYKLLHHSWILQQKKKTVFIIVCLSLVSSILAARFYTGQTPSSIIGGLINNNVSFYSEYQLYAKLNNISTFTLTKLPFIFMMFYSKLVLFYLFISYTLVKNEISNFEKICLGIAILSHIYFGIARGTNYELFEIVMLFIYTTLSRSSKVKRNRFSSKNIFYIVIAISVMIYLFYTRISDRGYVFDYTINKDFVFNEVGVLSQISENIPFVMILLYDYFGFGFYYVSYFVTEVLFSSFSNFISGLVPLGYAAQHNDSIQNIMRSNIVMSARWHPDFILLLNSVGFIGTVMLVFSMGYFNRFVNRQEKTSLVYLTQFIILMQLISFPIGNFVFVSSASTLIVTMLMFIWLWKLTINKRITFK